MTQQVTSTDYINRLESLIAEAQGLPLPRRVAYATSYIDLQFKAMSAIVRDLVQLQEKHNQLIATLNAQGVSVNVGTSQETQPGPGHSSGDR